MVLSFKFKISQNIIETQISPKLLTLVEKKY